MLFLDFTDSLYNCKSFSSYNFIFFYRSRSYNLVTFTMPQDSVASEIFTASVFDGEYF